jgi:dienelactone hydrolase
VAPKADRGLITVGLFIWLAALSPSRAADATSFPANMPQTPMNEQVLQIPTGGNDPVDLQVTVFTPDGPGPFPLAVLNHGSAAHGQPPAEMPRYRTTFSADYFLSRGYAVVLPMMRGFAGSGGKLQARGCDYESYGLNDAADIRAVIDHMVKQSYVDGTRIVVGGQSFGGWNTLALGSLNLPHVKGLVNFVGGMRASDCNRSDETLIAAAGDFGARTAVPSLWFYGDNDRLFSRPTWRGMYDRYTKAGGRAELVAFGKFLDDSHEMLSSYEGLRIWTPKVDAFLARIRMPSAVLYPQYMPIAAPPPSRYAVVGDVDAVPYLTDQGRELYRTFLKKPLPRAFAVATNGTASFSYAGFDPLLLALDHCQKSGHPCRLYAVDNDVVWSRPTPEPAPGKFAALSDVAAVPYLADKGRAGYRTFLTMRKPRAFAIAPDGGWDAASLGLDPLAFALDHCGKFHQGCRLYAVDADVVWSGPSE